MILTNGLKKKINLKTLNDMKITIEYFVRRKSDRMAMHLLHETITEEKLFELVRPHLTAPINYSLDDGSGNGEYFIDDIGIDKIEV